ncbi:MAG: hypothetical protein KDE25_08510 [Novosphingobium sp.]|nr:hypothetical protein [Novosphingobium sp.]
MSPIHGQRPGMSNTQIASLIGFAIAGGVVLQWPLGRLSDRFEQRMVIALSFAITAVICAALAMSHSTPVLTALDMLFGIWRQLVSAPLPAEGQHSFQILPRTSPMAASLDPKVSSDS